MSAGPRAQDCIWLPRSWFWQNRCVWLSPGCPSAPSGCRAPSGPLDALSAVTHPRSSSCCPSQLAALILQHPPFPSVQPSPSLPQHPPSCLCEFAQAVPLAWSTFSPRAPGELLLSLRPRSHVPFSEHPTGVALLGKPVSAELPTRLLEEAFGSSTSAAPGGPADNVEEV